MRVPADAAYEISVAGRNPNAQWRHDLSLIEPNVVAICAVCRAGDGPVSVGTRRAGEVLVFRLTVRTTAGRVTTLRSDAAAAAVVETTATGWRVGWEDGGGAPQDLIMGVRRVTETPVRVMTYNVQGFNLTQGGGTVADLASVVIAQKADVLGLPAGGA